MFDWTACPYHSARTHTHWNFRCILSEQAVVFCRGMWSEQLSVSSLPVWIYILGELHLIRLIFMEFDIKSTAGCSPAGRLYCNFQVHHLLANPETGSSHHSMYLQWGMGGKTAGEGKNDAVEEKKMHPGCVVVCGTLVGLQELLAS